MVGWGGARNLWDRTLARLLMKTKALLLALPSVVMAASLQPTPSFEYMDAGCNFALAAKNAGVKRIVHMSLIVAREAHPSPAA